VYWPGNTERTWFQLLTSSYAGRLQAIGVVFSRAHALEIERRLSRVAQVGAPDDLFRDPRVDGLGRLAYKRLRHSAHWPDDLHAIANLTWQDDSQLSAVSLAYLCADPALDWVVDQTDLPTLAVAHVEIPVWDMHGVHTVAHTLYDCRHIRMQALFDHRL
jgi:hypothetical protein